MKALSSILGLVLLSPCFVACDVPLWTKNSAREVGENVLADVLRSSREKRSDFDDPVVQLSDKEGTGALVGFRRHGTAKDGYTIVLGRNDCHGVSIGFGP